MVETAPHMPCEPLASEGWARLRSLRWGGLGAPTREALMLAGMMARFVRLVPPPFRRYRRCPTTAPPNSPPRPRLHFQIDERRVTHSRIDSRQRAQYGLYATSGLATSDARARLLPKE